jgi:amidohydrolase
MTAAPPIEAPSRALGLFTPYERELLLTLRRDLHRHPELSWKEERTAARLAEVLTALGASDVARVAGTGVVARIAGKSSGAAAVAIRGDIDALPIQEETALDFASQVPGVMHACGHDVHATWAIGAALLLHRMPAPTDVLIVLQPAEEVGGGARAILSSGALDRAAVIFGGHVDRRFPIGEVVAEAGSIAASADMFTIELVGRGAHGARPHESADPIVGVAALVSALQTIVSRRIDPAAAAVVTVGSIHGGTAPNVIPERVTLTGTLRAMRPDVRTRLQEEVRRLAVAIATAYDLAAEVQVSDGTPPLVNPPTAAGWARAAAEHVLGDGSVVPFGITNMGGEDFAYYLERIAGCFLRIGAREVGGLAVAAHSPRFYAADGSIFVGASVLAECARVAASNIATGDS